MIVDYDLTICPGGTVEDFNVDLEGKKVSVTSDLSSDDIMETLKKCGKAVSYVGTA